MSKTDRAVLPQGGVGPSRESESEGLRLAALYLVDAIRCALAGTDAPEKPQSVSWERVFALAESNSVASTAWYGVRNDPSLPPDLAKAWGSRADVALFRLLRFDAEREAVCARMEQEGLSYLPLKGILVARYYPLPGMRAMADNDILYGFVEADPAGGYRICGKDEAAQEATVKRAMGVMSRIMARRGFSCEHLGEGNHDSFYRKPHYNFEMHRRLMAAGSPLADYYANPWKRAVRDPEAGDHAFRFSDEDEYLYLLAHAWKHYDGAGCGIRFLVDLCVFMRAKGESLDWGYVRSELSLMQMEEFERWARELALAAFGDSSPSFAPVLSGSASAASRLSTVQQERMLFLLGCGTYGNLRVLMRHRLDKLSAERDRGKAASRVPLRLKARYLWRRAFPGPEHRAQFSPAFAEHPALMPLFPFYRLGKAVRKLATDPKKIVDELKMLKRLK